MSRFTKKNIVLIVVLAASGVAAAVLLIYSAIVWISLLGKMDETNSARDKVSSLTKAKPAPGRKNEERIEGDIKIFEKASVYLRNSFVHPLQPAVDEFIKTLCAPDGARLNDGQRDRFRVVPKNNDELSDEQRSRLPMRKLTLDEFKEFFRESFEEKARPTPRDPERESLGTLQFFINGFRSNFRNWNAAMAKFRQVAQPLTSEQIDSTNDIAILLNAMGFRRAVDIDGFPRLIENYRAVIQQKAEKGKLDLSADALSFMLGTSGDLSRDANALKDFKHPSDVRQVFFHWDVYGNIIDHLTKASVKQLVGIRVRDFAERPEEGRKIGNLSETVGAYRIYHYTVEISGSMESIRNFCKQLDLSYNSRRPYILRSVTLYAEENGASILMKQYGMQNKNEGNSENPENEEVGRRRRRRRVQPAAENSGESDAQREREAERRRYAEEMKALAPDKRPGYGAIVVGLGDQYRAFVDFDYVVLDQNQ